jgi:hypothetical protein
MASKTFLICVFLLTELASAEASFSSDSIIGVTLFSEIAPQDFGAFDRAFVSMFRLTAGETWLDSLERFDENGQLNYTHAMFVLSYIILVVWVLLQVHFDSAPLALMF